MKNKKIRYGVVGLGHIAQTAILPAFKNAQKNSVLSALVSSNTNKLKFLSKKYDVKNCYDYSEFETMLKNNIVDAVYIATPNTCHKKFIETAAKYGVHVLSEKPLTTSVNECLQLQKTISESNIVFMTGYRLHFDEANLEAIKIASSGQLGSLRIFNSVFTMQVRDENNIRLKKNMGGGTLFDIGIYCINAARNLFGSEPYEVFATNVIGTDSRFFDVDEMTTAILRFPNNQIASFTCSFGASDCSTFDLLGTQGSLRLENAYDYAKPMKLTVTTNKKTQTKKYSKHDQFAAELLYFSNCIRNYMQPEPSIKEALIDIEIIESLLLSISTGGPVRIVTDEKFERPTYDQKITRPGIQAPHVIHATSPGEKH